MTEQTASAPTRGFVQGGDHLERLRNRPGALERVNSIREGMREMDRVHAMNLAAIRKAADYTQVELAERLGVGQGVVSRTERSKDILLSTLANYLSATGAESASIVVRVHGIDVELDLFELLGRGATDGAGQDR